MATFTASDAQLVNDLAERRTARFDARPIWAFTILLGAVLLLFARLGTYSLWTDEASTAITARGVWHTGDTTAWLNDHNLLTYRDGLLLKGQKDRYTSPLQFFLAAPFIGLLGDTAFACRLPFALCGLATVGLIVRWMWRGPAPTTAWIAAAVLLLTNASFFLFQRQCRYYAPATLLSTLTAYLYVHWTGRRRELLGIGVTMALLLATQYLDYAAVVACLLVDCIIWGRRRRAIRGVDWLVLITPQIVMAVIVCPIWNPIARAESAISPNIAPAAHAAIAAASTHHWLGGFLTIFWWNFRDLIACDFAILATLLLCPLLALSALRIRRSRDFSEITFPYPNAGRASARATFDSIENSEVISGRCLNEYSAAGNCWLVRAPLALLVFLGTIAFFTAHPIAGPGNAEVRYLAPLLPLCIAIGILALSEITHFPVWAKASVFVMAALSATLSPGESSAVPSFESTSAGFYSELVYPAVEPYSPLAKWITANVPERATIYVCPDWCVSPIMWDAPRATYVWQLSDPPKSDYAALPDIYFKGRVPPDYLIGFGPYLDEIKSWQATLAARGVRYGQVTAIPVYWKEQFRPELIWRSSTATAPRAGDEVYVFRRIPESDRSSKAAK